MGMCLSLATTRSLNTLNCASIYEVFYLFKRLNTQTDFGSQFKMLNTWYPRVINIIKHFMYLVLWFYYSVQLSMSIKQSLEISVWEPNNVNCHKFHPPTRSMGRRILQTISLAAWPWCWGRSWNRFSWVQSHSMYRTTRASGPAHTVLGKAGLLEQPDFLSWPRWWMKGCGCSLHRLQQNLQYCLLHHSPGEAYRPWFREVHSLLHGWAQSGGERN